MIVKKYPLSELPPLLKRVESFGFKVFSSGDYDLNIIGERRMIDRQDNRFDDWIHVAYPLGYEWIIETAEATTDPGRYWLTKPDYKACAVFHHPQQCRGAYKLGLHRSSYKALCQRKPVFFWRDQNKDAHADYRGRVVRGLIGLNVHRSSKSRKDGSTYVDKWSAGCQVYKVNNDFLRLIELCEKQIETLGYDSFTYTLIPQEVS